MRVFVIFQEREKSKISEDLNIIESIINYNFKNIESIIVFVDNSNEYVQRSNKIDSNIYMISADDENWEFSAYDEGYRWIIDNFKVEADDIFLVANETNNREYNQKYLKFFKNKKIIKWVNDDKVVGFVGENIKPIKILDMYVKKYVATHLFFLNYKILKEIIPFSITVSNKDIFSNDYNDFFKKTAPLDKSFIEGIEARVFGWKNNHNVFGFYHQAQPLTLENFDFFKGKVRSIICEYYIGAKIENQNIKLVNLKNLRLFRKTIKPLLKYKIVKNFILLLVRKGYIKTLLRTSKINIE